MSTTAILTLTELETGPFAAISEVNAALSGIEQSTNQVNSFVHSGTTVALTENQLLRNFVHKCTSATGNFDLTYPATVTQTLPGGGSSSNATRRLFAVLNLSANTITVKSATTPGTTVSVPTLTGAIVYAEGVDCRMVANT